MKIWFSAFRLSLVLGLLIFLVPQPNYAAMHSDAVQKHVVSAVPAPTAKHATKTTRHHTGFWVKAKQKWQKTKSWFDILLNGEPASTLAKVALFLFCGSIGLSIITNLVFVTVSAFVSTIISLALLASVVISLIILFSDENKKSKAIAKAILITVGAMTLLAILLLALVIAAFSGW